MGWFWGGRGEFQELEGIKGIYLSGKPFTAVDPRFQNLGDSDAGVMERSRHQSQR